MNFVSKSVPQTIIIPVRLLVKHRMRRCFLLGEMTGTAETTVAVETTGAAETTGTAETTETEMGEALITVIEPTRSCQRHLQNAG